MTTKEAALRGLALYLGCLYAAVKLKNALAQRLDTPSPLVQKEKVEGVLLKEIGILFRFWVTRQVWEGSALDEVEAKLLNGAVMKAFNDGFELRDSMDAGVRYAKLSGTAEEIKEFGRRVCDSLGMECYVTTFEFNMMSNACFKPIAELVHNVVNMPASKLDELAGELEGDETAVALANIEAFASQLWRREMFGDLGGGSAK